MNATKEEMKKLRKAKRYLDRYLLVGLNPVVSIYVNALSIHSNITQTRLGELLGYSSKGSLSLIVNGKRSMSLEKKKVLAELLKLNKSERLALMEGE